MITTLVRVGSPLIRYRTGDRVRAAPPDSALHTPHSAFLHLAGGVLGRTDEMITIRGNNLYPSSLEDVIRGFPEIVEFRIELRTIKAMQHLKIDIEPAAQVDAAGSARLAADVAETIKTRWHFQAEVITVPPGTLPRFEMKARRFIRE